WSQTFGAGRGLSVQQTTDGGYIITGYTWPVGNGYDVYLIKTDGSGIEQWSQTFGGTGYDEGYSVQQTTDGGYIITGWTSGNVYLLKTDGNGVEQWSQTFGEIDSGQIAYSVQQTDDGGYIISGHNSENIFNADKDIFQANFWIIKTDVNGIEQWNRAYSGNAGTLDAYLGGCSVKQTTDGGYIISGSDYSNSGISVAYILKVDYEGDSVWSNDFSDLFFRWPSNAEQTSDGGYVIGVTYLHTGNQKPALIKTDDNGTVQWSQVYESLDAYVTDVQQTTDGGYIITGYADAYDEIDCNNIAAYLIKTNSFGNITSTFEIPLPNPNRKLDKTIDILGREANPQPNTPLIEIYDDGTVEKKIIIE
ncbi:MAG: hypothetical protein HOC66_01760, partial [Flavobacteriales bacterium]|nr:hypothetical protein [Flavobacteriales bacterium]